MREGPTYFDLIEEEDSPQQQQQSQQQHSQPCHSSQPRTQVPPQQDVEEEIVVDAEPIRTLKLEFLFKLYSKLKEEILQ